MEEKLYLNVDRLYKELLAIYKEERDGWLEEGNRDFLIDELSDDTLEELAMGKAYEINNDMRKYLNRSDHAIMGNFNNIDYDYPKHINGQFGYDRMLVNAMIARLNSGEVSEQADADRNWLVDWFWETCGSIGIRRNFGDYVSVLLTVFEKQE